MLYLCNLCVALLMDLFVVCVVYLTVFVNCLVKQFPICLGIGNMAELEIDKEDVHDRSKWRRVVNVKKRKSNPIGKRTINR